MKGKEILNRWQDLSTSDEMFKMKFGTSLIRKLWSYSGEEIDKSLTNWKTIAFSVTRLGYF